MKERIVLATMLSVIMLSSTALGATKIQSNSNTFNNTKNVSKTLVESNVKTTLVKDSKRITKSEVLALILSVTGVEVQKVDNATTWDAGIIKTAVAEGLISGTKFDGQKDFTNAEISTILVKALGLEGTQVTKKYFVDSKGVAENILASKGLISGATKNRGVYVYPNKAITRIEALALMAKVKAYVDTSIVTTPIVIEPVIVVNPIITEPIVVTPIIVEPTKLAIVTSILKDSEKEVTKEPMTIEAFEKILMYMASENLAYYSINYTSLGFSALNTNEVKETILGAFNNVFSKYPEYFSFTNSLGYELKGSTSTSTIVLNLSNAAFTHDELKEMRKVFYTEVETVVKNLIDTNKLTLAMTDKEKAKVLYDWVINNTKYDYAFQSKSYTGYGQIVNGLAVCQGYTATYNLMCKMVGLDVQGISGLANNGTGDSQEHIWTLATLDGEKVHIDVTWGDSYATDGKVNYNYFAATSDFMKQTHTWDTAIFGN